jgi:glycosyltransferase involved in cell wall biosynthesis
MRKKNIMQICLSPDLGGLELYLKQCVDALSDDFSITTVIGEKTKLKEYFDEKGIAYFQVARAKPLQALFRAKKLAKIIDDNKIEIIHMHWTKDILLVVLAKLFSKQKPKIIQSRHMHMTRFKDDFYHRFLYKNVDTILAVTQEVKEELKRYIPDSIRPKIEQLYLGCDTVELLDEAQLRAKKDELGIYHDSFNIGLVGRIEPAKGQHLLIEAIKMLNDKNINAHAHLVGNPMKDEYLETLNTQISYHDIKENIHFLGYLKNPAHFYQANDVMVLATENETFGLVLIEAMRTQTCVVGANRGGVLEIIDDKKTGLLFESQNSEDLANKLEILYHDKTKREAISQAGYHKVSCEFDNVKQFEKLKSILKKIEAHYHGNYKRFNTKKV